MNAMQPKVEFMESFGERRLVLPGGIFNPDGRICREVRVRELTGLDEELLFDSAQPSGARRVSAFLARAIDTVAGIEVPIDADFAADLQLGDRDYLLLRLRQMDLGDAIHQVMRCPACARKVDVDLSISELPVRRLKQAQPRWHLRLPVGAGSEHELEVRLPTGADQEAVEQIALRNPAAANTRLFARVVLDIDGAGQPSEAQARDWPLALRAQLAAWLEEHSPGPDLFLDLDCPYCSADMSYAFDLQAFFLTSV